MRNDRLRDFFEELGFKNVQSVISSGNILFESDDTDMKSMEEKVETALPKKLGFSSTTIIRSHQQLQKLVDSDPFQGVIHSPTTYLMVTFSKSPLKTELELPHQPPAKPYKLMNIVDGTAFTSTDTTAVPTTDLMAWLEKQFGKQISSRTLLTVHRILKKLN
jgi:uncharacterized protein (DUF1697 family)